MKCSKYIIFLVLCSFFIILLIYDIYKISLFSSFPETDAVLKSYEYSYTDDIGDNYNGTFEYEVNGQKYEAFCYIDASETIDNYKKSIQYNPENPSEYEFAANGVGFVTRLVILVFLCIGFFIILSALMKKRNQQEKNYNNKPINIRQNPEVYLKLFNTNVEVLSQEDKVTSEYENKCIEYFNNMGKEKIIELCKKTMDYYRKLEKEHFYDIPKEDYEKFGLIKDAEYVDETIVLKHITPGYIQPIYSKEHKIYFTIGFDVSWDLFDHELGMYWEIKDEEVSVGDL